MPETLLNQVHLAAQIAASLRLGKVGPEKILELYTGALELRRHGKDAKKCAGFLSTRCNVGSIVEYDPKTAETEKSDQLGILAHWYPTRANRFSSR
ncbi:MAG: hypothetical protein AAF183_03675 [Pseudomonadota bacterium]